MGLKFKDTWHAVFIQEYAKDMWITPQGKEVRRCGKRQAAANGGLIVLFGLIQREAEMNVRIVIATGRELPYPENRIRIVLRFFCQHALKTSRGTESETYAHNKKGCTGRSRGSQA